MPGRNLHVAFLRSIIFKVFIHRVTLAVLVCASQCWVWSPGHRSSCDHYRLIQGCDCGDDEGRSPTIFLFSSSNDTCNRIILWKALASKEWSFLNFGCDACCSPMLCVWCRLHTDARALQRYLAICCQKTLEPSVMMIFEVPLAENIRCHDEGRLTLS